ncbi:hypothetical protein [Komagataeibacter kakiaceti]
MTILSDTLSLHGAVECPFSFCSAFPFGFILVERIMGFGIGRDICPSGNVPITGKGWL